MKKSITGIFALTAVMTLFLFSFSFLTLSFAADTSSTPTSPLWFDQDLNQEKAKLIFLIQKLKNEKDLTLIQSEEIRSACSVMYVPSDSGNQYSKVFLTQYTPIIFAKCRQFLWNWVKLATESSLDELELRKSFGIIFAIITQISNASDERWKARFAEAYGPRLLPEHEEKLRLIGSEALELWEKRAHQLLEVQSTPSLKFMSDFTHPNISDNAYEIFVGLAHLYRKETPEKLTGRFKFAKNLLAYAFFTLARADKFLVDMAVIKEDFTAILQLPIESTWVDIINSLGPELGRTLLEKIRSELKSNELNKDIFPNGIEPYFAKLKKKAETKTNPLTSAAAAKKREPEKQQDSPIVTKANEEKKPTPDEAPKIASSQAILTSMEEPTEKKSRQHRGKRKKSGRNKNALKQSILVDDESILSGQEEQPKTNQPTETTQPVGQTLVSASNDLQFQIIPLPQRERRKKRSELVQSQEVAPKKEPEPLAEAAPDPAPVAPVAKGATNAIPPLPTGITLNSDATDLALEQEIPESEQKGPSVRFTSPPSLPMSTRSNFDASPFALEQKDTSTRPTVPSLPMLTPHKDPSTCSTLPPSSTMPMQALFSLESIAANLADQLFNQGILILARTRDPQGQDRKFTIEFFESAARFLTLLPENQWVLERLAFSKYYLGALKESPLCLKQAFQLAGKLTSEPTRNWLFFQVQSTFIHQQGNLNINSYPQYDIAPRQQMVNNPQPSYSYPQYIWTRLNN